MMATESGVPSGQVQGAVVALLEHLDDMPLGARRFVRGLRVHPEHVLSVVEMERLRNLLLWCELPEEVLDADHAAG
jgi:hypothetical protein